MVGILLVSHSKKLAEGAKELAQQMINKSVPLKAVGGTTDGRLGTESNLIYQALDDMKTEDGVIVLVDMGSAVMNTELAFEFFSEEEQEKFKIVNAPLVEAAVFCALQSSFDKSRDQIIDEINLEELSQKKI